MNEKPVLPRNFSWLEESKVAGCARPETEAELLAVKAQGIRSIMSLTGTPLNPDIVNHLGFEYSHSHISGAPTNEQLQQIIQFIGRQVALGKPVLVHCGEGKGRTGTVLAAYLVYHGFTADEAIRTVREKRPGSIESPEQEDAVRKFQRSLENSR